MQSPQNARKVTSNKSNTPLSFHSFIPSFFHYFIFYLTFRYRSYIVAISKLYRSKVLLWCSFGPPQVLLWSKDNFAQHRRRIGRELIDAHHPSSLIPQTSYFRLHTSYFRHHLPVPIPSSRICKILLTLLHIPQTLKKRIIQHTNQAIPKKIDIKPKNTPKIPNGSIPIIVSFN